MEMLAGGAGLYLMGTMTGEWGRLDLAAITRLRCGAGIPDHLWVAGGFVAYTWLLRVAPTRWWQPMLTSTL
jgi:hypothetical protein